MLIVNPINHLEPQMTLVLIGKRPCFEGLTFKNRGHGWVLGMSMTTGDKIDNVEAKKLERWIRF